MAGVGCGAVVGLVVGVGVAVGSGVGVGVAVAVGVGDVAMVADGVEVGWLILIMVVAGVGTTDFAAFCELRLLMFGMITVTRTGMVRIAEKNSAYRFLSGNTVYHVLMRSMIVGSGGGGGLMLGSGITSSIGSYYIKKAKIMNVSPS